VQAATALSEATLIPRQVTTGDDKQTQRLHRLVRLGLKTEKNLAARGEVWDGEEGMDQVYGHLDLEEDSSKEGPSGSRVSPNFVTRFIATHKDKCRCAKFSHDGKFVATGSQDTSIKLIDVDKMKSFSQAKGDTAEELLPKPVTRTFYDHSKPINDLEFHPFSPLLISASSDHTVKFYDYSKSSAKRAHRHLQEALPVTSVSLHPSGDYLLVAVKQNVVRLYDVSTFQAFTAADSKDHHTDFVNHVRFARQGNMYASCSKDGTIKIWDGVSSKCVHTITNAHSGLEVSTIDFSFNGKYLLSSGKDSSLRLWEVSTARQLLTFLGATQSKYRLRPTWNYREDFVIGCDENSNSAIVWDSRTGEQLSRLSGHNNMVRWVASSPTENALLTCSDDNRARFWLG
jgi:cleavage stimulation factor subunit 1